MNPKSWKFAACAVLLGGCASNDAPAPVVAVVEPGRVVVAVVTAKPKPSPTKSFFVGAKPTPFPTTAHTPKPMPTVAPFVTKPVKGFSESERQKIFSELVGAEDRAMADAESSFSPIDDSANYLAEVDRLTPKYKAEVVAKFRLSKKQAEGISDEGVDNQWPPLTPLKSSYRN